MKLFSSVVNHGDYIPLKYTCDGEDTSPPLEWSEVPEGTKSFVLIMDDPDAPRGVFLHWLIVGIDPAERGLTEHIGLESKRTAGATQCRNDFGKHGYGGPCPPSGEHRYFFRLLALDTELRLGPDAKRADVERAMEGHVIEEAELMCRYIRSAVRK